jgi:hypothetical protein
LTRRHVTDIAFLAADDTQAWGPVIGTCAIRWIAASRRLLIYFAQVTLRVEQVGGLGQPPLRL